MHYDVPVLVAYLFLEADALGQQGLPVSQSRGAVKAVMDRQLTSTSFPRGVCEGVCVFLKERAVTPGRKAEHTAPGLNPKGQQAHTSSCSFSLFSFAEECLWLKPQE